MRLPLIVSTVGVGQYVVKVATTLVTVVVPNSPLVATLTAVPELTLDAEDAAVPDGTVLLDRVTAV